MSDASRPNILIINPDEMRADVMSHLGCEAIETRHLDTLAGDGASFEGAFCQSPVCVPSRCSFLTGWYPHVAGHRTMAAMLGPEEPLLFRYLKAEGYHVWASPRNDYLPAQTPGYHADSADTWFMNAEMEDVLAEEKLDELRRMKQGEDGFMRGEIPERRSLDDIWVDGVCDFINSHAQSGQQKPFCAFLPLQMPHPPYEAAARLLARVDRSKLTKRIAPPAGFAGKSRMTKALHEKLGLSGWSDADFDEVRVTYLAMCLQVDEYVGRIVQTLKQQGLYDNTTIFVLSDHGDYAGDYSMLEKQQNAFEDCLTRVPFIVKLPKGMQKRHGVQKGLVELVDFYATAEALAGFSPQHTHFGNSLVPFLAGEDVPLRDAVFCEGGFRKGESQCFRSEGTQPPPPGHRYHARVSLQMDSAEMFNGKAVMCRTEHYMYVKRLYEPDELYDLRKDPGEVVNVAQHPEYEGVLHAMQHRLTTFYLDTSDAVPFTLDARQDPVIVQRMRERLHKSVNP